MQLGCTLGELGQRMTAAEFALWAEYRRVRPWGGELDELLAGTISATVANYAGKSRAKDAPSAVPADFMPIAARERAAEDVPEPDPVAFFTAIQNQSRT